MVLTLRGDSPPTYTKSTSCRFNMCSNICLLGRARTAGLKERRNIYRPQLILIDWVLLNTQTRKLISVHVAPPRGDKVNCNYGSQSEPGFWSTPLWWVELDFPQGGEICQARLTQWLKLECCRKNPLSYETNMVCADKLASYSRSAFPLESGKLYLFISFKSCSLNMTEGRDLPSNPVGKLYNIIFCPWSLVGVGKITL